MLFIESRRADRQLDEAARVALLERLQEKGFAPVIRSARLHAFELALAGHERVKDLERQTLAWAENEGDTPYTSGDLFCYEDYALFLVFGDADDALGTLRAGIVYRDDTAEPRQKLEAFCRNVRDALESARAEDSENAGAPVGVEWEAVEARVPEGFARFASSREGEAARSAASSEGGAAARVTSLLEDAGTRRLLRRLIEAEAEGRTADLLADGGEMAAEPLLGRLRAAGLVRREVLVSCRKRGRALFRLPSLEAFEMVSASSAVCSECGAAVADERVEELVRPTELAASALKEGAWMANRLRALLRNELGLAEDAIAARPRADDGELQLMANVGGEPFLFYLRDGDLGAQQARRALDLEAETDASHLVVVAAGKIQDEARARLREHARRRARTGSEVEVLLVEGFDAAAAELRHAFERVSQRALAAELYPLDSGLGLGVGQMLAARFRLAHKHGALRDLAAAAASTVAGSLREM